VEVGFKRGGMGRCTRVAESSMTVAPWTILSSRAEIASRPLLTIRFRYVRSAGGARSVRASMDPSVQILKPGLKVCLELSRGLLLYLIDQSSYI
jgi:hypothetical protein